MSVSEIVTRSIIEIMRNEQTLVWKSKRFGLDKCNFNRRKPYSVLNQLLLSGDDNRFYLTRKEIKSLGKVYDAGCNKPIITFWKIYEKETGNIVNGKPEVQKIPVLRFYNVIGIDNIIDFDQDISPLDMTPDIPIDEFVFRSGANFQVRDNLTVAKYDPETDTIFTPPKEDFDDVNEYYYDLTSALVRWTSGKDRIKGRDPEDTNRFGMERLISEIGSAMILKAYNMTWEDRIGDTALHVINGWCNAMEENENLIIYAASRAEKAVSFLRGEKDFESVNVFDAIRGLAT